MLIGETMIFYTPGMFDVTNLKEVFKPLYAKKETFEFQLNILEEKFDGFKRVNFPEMLIYEKKKVHEPKLIPDRIVLDQYKKIEDEPAVDEFRQRISKLKRQIKNTEVEITNAEATVKSMFSFTDKNYELYVNNLNKYYKGGMQFTEMMEIIFEKEFNKKSIYYEVAGLRNYPIIHLLYEKAPVKCKDTMLHIYEESKVVYMLEDYMIVDQYDVMENGEVDKVKVAAMAQTKYERYLRGTN